MSYPYFGAWLTHKWTEAGQGALNHVANLLEVVTAASA